ncbi:hypothetical protein V0288_05250 [Pannus brasiliensis CCIBt3594]|uniref:Uncharacterized protein n=1 Tax=Pannus brasiliensis CCIBt3594 TaxID=1427578 RepID=A0AAW9QSQ2_9CHRO
MPNQELKETILSHGIEATIETIFELLVSEESLENLAPETRTLLAAGFHNLLVIYCRDIAGSVTIGSLQ